MSALLAWMVIAQAGAVAPAAGEPQQWVLDTWTEALVAIESIDDTYRAAQALAELAESQVSGGYPARAHETAQRALAAAERVSAPALRAWVLRDIGIALSSAGELSAASRTADRIDDPQLRDAVLESIAGEQNRSGDLSAVRRTAQRLHDRARRGRVMHETVLRQITAGDLSGALATARSINDDTYNALALGDVAAAEARDDHVSAALSLSARIRNRTLRSRAFADIVAIQARAGDVAASAATLERVEDPLLRALAVARSALAQAGRGQPSRAVEDFDRATAMAAEVRGAPERRSAVLADIAAAQLSGGHEEGARRTLQLALKAVDEIRSIELTTAPLRAIARTQAQAGDFAGALRTALMLEDSTLRMLLIRDVIASRAEVGDVDEALRAARNLRDPQYVAAALFGIIRVHEDAGDSAGVKAVADSMLPGIRAIDHVGFRVDAFGALAAAQLSAGDAAAGRAIFAEASSLARAPRDPAERASLLTRLGRSLADGLR